MIKYIFSVISLLFILTGTSFSQSVKVSGKITDASSLPVVGASVVFTNATEKKGVNTDVEGRFFITLDKSKTYAVKISSVGFAAKEINTIGLDASDNGALNFILEKANKQLENVTVTASAKKEAVASLYAAQKNSSSISDGISAEVIKKSPDRNTGEIIKRVSGASVQDNKFVVIRGLSERYNVSMLNNAILPSTEADKKAFAFDIIPSSVVDNLVIYKSPTPDLPGDFAGGAIKVLTKDYPSKKISELSLSIGYNSLTTGKNFYKGFPDGKYDALGFFDDSRLIPGPYYRNRDGFILQSPAYKKEVTKLFPNTYGYQPANKSLPNIGISYTGGNTNVLKNGNKLGYVYSIGYSNGRATSERLRDEYDITRRTLYNYSLDNYDEKNSLSALLNITYSYKKSKISFKNLFNNNFVKTSGLRYGVNEENQGSPFNIKSNNTEATGNGLVNSVVEGLHKINKDWTIDWNGSFGFTYKNQPDQKILTFRSLDNSANSAYYLKLSNENSPEIRNAGRVYSFLQEFIYGASANVAKQFNWLGQPQKLKFGTMNYYRDRSVEVDAMGYSSLSFLGVTIPETKGTTFNNIFSTENVDRYNLTVANIATNSANYTANAMLNAGYAMLDNKFSDKVKLTWGARIEKYRQELSAKNRKTQVYDNTDVLPSLLFTYAVNNKSNIRVAGSQSVNRPEFRELADYSVYDYDNNLVVRGNPNLVRSKNTNADLRYEWFPAAGEIISASVFYKYFKNPIEQVNKGNDVLSYENADNATAYGVEVEVRKKLDFIGNKFFDQLTLYTNAAYIKGSVQFNGVAINSPLQGQSPYLINAGVNYVSPNESFSVNLLYNRIGPRLRFRAINGASLNIFERPRDVVDFQISKKLINNKLELKLTVSDIFAQPFQWYYKYDETATNTNYKASEDKIITSNTFGTTASIGLRYNFGK